MRAGDVPEAEVHDDRNAPVRGSRHVRAMQDVSKSLEHVDRKPAGRAVRRRSARRLELHANDVRGRIDDDLPGIRSTGEIHDVRTVRPRSAHFAIALLCGRQGPRPQARRRVDAFINCQSRPSSKSRPYPGIAVTSSSASSLFG